MQLQGETGLQQLGCLVQYVHTAVVDVDFDGYILDLIDTWKATYPGALFLLWSGSQDVQYASISATCVPRLVTGACRRVSRAAQQLERPNPFNIPLLSQDNAEAQICRRADVQSIYAAAIGSLPKSMYALTEAVVDLGIVESASQFRAHLAVIDAAVRHAHY